MANDEDRSIVIAEDVARLAKVSLSAVSRAFTPGASVAPKTRERILAAAESVGYRPNLIARSLTRGRSHIVGVGVGNLANPLLSGALDLLSTRLAEAGLRVLLFTTNEASVVQAPIDDVLQYRLDAVVLLAAAPSSRLFEECARANVPVVLFNRRGSSEDAAFGVSGDNAGGGRSIAAFLAAGGHRRFAFVAGVAASQASCERQASFTEFLCEQGHEGPMIEHGLHTYDGASAATRRLLRKRERPDAIFCANDLMALAAIDVARSEFGLVVGQELSIIGFDDIPMAAWPSFSLTTYAQPLADLVETAVDLVQAARSGAAPAQRTVGGALVIRGSARRPAASTATRLGPGMQRLAISGKDAPR